MGKKIGFLLPANPKFLIYGAGVLGSQFAAYMHANKMDVSLLARGEKGQRYSQEGIKIKDYYHK